MTLVVCALRLYNGDAAGRQFGPRCCRGDRIGCGIRSENAAAGIATVFFTQNRREVGVAKSGPCGDRYQVSCVCVCVCPQVGCAEVPLSAEGLFPAVGMHSLGEEVKVDLQAQWHPEEDESMMMVDSLEDDWGRLHDVRASGTVGASLGVRRYRSSGFPVPFQGETLPCVSGSNASGALLFCLLGVCSLVPRVKASLGTVPLGSGHLVVVF